MMNLSVTDIATINVEFEPAELLREVVREIVNDDNGPGVIGNAILDGTDQLYGNELAEILDEIVDLLAVAAMNNREGDDE